MGETAIADEDPPQQSLHCRTRLQPFVQVLPSNRMVTLPASIEPNAVRSCWKIVLDVGRALQDVESHWTRALLCHRISQSVQRPMK